MKSKQRGGFAPLFFVCLSLFVLTTGMAQLRNQKRITGLQLGEAPEGSRVTIVSDSPLNDYEAFRQGDRFFVKIPLADFNSTFPQLRADGFDGVQVQRVGDNVVVSFKLQPGATARVDQRSNRLDVIFSSPARSTRKSSDLAGPLPAGSELAFRQRVVTPPAPDGSEGPAPQNSRTQNNSRAGSSRNSNRGTPLTSGNNAVKSPSAVPSPSSMLSPATSRSYPPLTTSSPAAPSSTNVSGGSSAARWVSANRLATLLGALILLSLIVYLALTLRRRGKGGTKAKRLKVLKAQPKVQPKVQPNVQPTDSPDVEMPEHEFDKEPAIATAAGHTSSVLTKPSIASHATGQDELIREEEEREVFEL